MPVKDKTYKRSGSLAALRDAPAGAATTLTAAAAKGATTINVALATGITGGKSVRLGSGEDIERVDVLSVASLVVTLARPLTRDHANATAVVEQTAYNLGDTTGGLEIAQAMESTDVQSDMRRLVYNKLAGFGSMNARTSLLGFTHYYLCVALGIPFTRVTGAGTLASPRFLATDFNDVDSVENTCIVATQVLQDGTVRTQEAWGVAVDYSGLSTALKTGDPAAVPVNFVVVGSAVEYDGAPPFTASETYRARKGAIFGSLTGLYAYMPATTGAFSTTTSGATAADAAAIVCTSATGISPEDRVVLSSEDTAEIHWVASKATNTFTVRGRTLRAHATGTPVVRLTRVKLATTRDGVTFNMGGSTTPQYEGSRRMPIAMQPGAVDASLSAQLIELTLANLALISGIPASEISGNRLVRTEKLGTAPILGLAVEGLLADGVTVSIFEAWGTAQDLSNIVTRYLAGEATYPLAAAPSSGIALYQYS